LPTEKQTAGKVFSEKEIYGLKNYDFFKGEERLPKRRRNTFS